MLKTDTRIQLDLFANLNVDRILLGTTELKYEREFGAVFVDFPTPLEKGHLRESISTLRQPGETGRFGGIAFKQDPAGRPWINTACQGTGASVWWPNKDQQRDEVENMRLSVAIPNDLVDVRTAGSWERPIWATGTRGGTGSSSTQSTTTASR